MAAVRSHACIRRPAADVWAAFADPTAIRWWFPGVQNVEFDGTTRTVTIEGRGTLVEEVLSCDDAIRRFRYRIVGGNPSLTSHVGVVDVIAIDDDSSLVVHTCLLYTSPSPRDS